MCSRTTKILLLLLLPLVRAAIKNVTIDDTFGDSNTGATPTYVPNPWQHPDCGGCAIKPPLANVVMRSYSALTFMPEKFPLMSIQFSFQGTAVYVYFILPNFVSDGTTTETLCNFTLDGNFVTTYHHIPTTSRDYIFNALVFSQDNLANKSHTLLISTSGLNRHVFTSFDYAVYQYDDGTDSTTSQPSPTTTPDQPVTTPTPRTVTTVVSDTPVSTQISNTITQSDPTSSSSDTISSPSPSSSPGATIVDTTAQALRTTRTSGTTGTILVTSSSSSGTPESSNSGNDNNAAHKTPTGAIAGGVVGGVALILFIILLFVLCHRRRRTHIDLPSTSPDPTPQHPVLTPFTPSSPDNADIIETRALEGGLPFTPIRKQRDAAQMPEHRSHHSPSASAASRSEMLGAQRQSTITEQINSLKMELDASASSTSGRSRRGGSDVTEILQQNKAMKAEIERLQAQLNSDWAQGFTNEPPPGYSRHVADIHRLTSSTGPIPIS